MPLRCINVERSGQTESCLTPPIIHGATLRILPAMALDMPPSLIETTADAIAENAARAHQRQSEEIGAKLKGREPEFPSGRLQQRPRSCQPHSSACGPCP